MSTTRIVLEPLQVSHAAAMVEVLGDPSLYVFTGGSPPGIRELAERYGRQVVGRSADGSETWLTWVVTDLDGVPLGYVQATVGGSETGDATAEVAWVIAAPQQGHGYATEAATAMIAWLRAHDVSRFVAHIHPGHAASEAIAHRLGLRPTAAVLDGERRWETPAVSLEP